MNILEEEAKEKRKTKIDYVKSKNMIINYKNKVTWQNNKKKKEKKKEK